MPTVLGTVTRGDQRPQLMPGSPGHRRGAGGLVALTQRIPGLILWLLIPLSEATAGSSGTLILRGTVPLTANIAIVQPDNNSASGTDDPAAAVDGGSTKGTSMTFSRIDPHEDASSLESGEETGTTFFILQAN